MDSITHWTVPALAAMIIARAISGADRAAVAGVQADHPVPMEAVEAAAVAIKTIMPVITAMGASPRGNMEMPSCICQRILIR